MNNLNSDRLDLQQEAILDPNIQFTNPVSEYLTQPQAILLTGATGLLGCHLLTELLRNSNADIYCLVRSRNPDGGQERIEQSLKAYGLDQEVERSRIIPLVGDLGQPLLGLSTETFQELATKVDVIYHNGAYVNYAYPYERLKAPNVLGTVEIIKLASLVKTKAVHFTSSISVFFSKAHGSAKEILETDIPQYHPSLKGGYKQSKWVAEKLISSAIARGLPGAIYRPVRIMGHSKTGVMGNVSDLLVTLLKGCIQMGKYPAATASINLVPVDYVAQAIAGLSWQTASLGKAFHLSNAQPLAWEAMWAGVNSAGYQLEELSEPEWMKELETFANKYPDNKIFALLLLLLSSPHKLFAEKPLFCDHQTQAGLANTSVTFPPVDGQLIATYCKYFQKSGYLGDGKLEGEEEKEAKKQKKTSGFWKSIKGNMSRQRRMTIKPFPREGQIPLSFGQERLWHIDSLNPENTVHNLHASYQLDGRLNISALESSIQEIINRHEILRSSFPIVEGQPVQVIAPEIQFKLKVIEGEDSEIPKMIEEQSQQPFDLNKSPLIRFLLVKVTDTKHYLLRTAHHIVTDFWSDTILLKELASLYQAFTTEQEPSLPKLPIQYADFAQFQRQWLQGKNLEYQLDYWRTQLSSDISILDLPTDYASATIASYQGASHLVKIPAEVTKSLKSISHSEGVSLFVTLLTGFKTLLYQYSGQENIILSSPVAGRYLAETKKLIGYFSNILLLNTDFSNDPTLQELLHRISEVTLGAQKHQDLPLQKIVEEIGISDGIVSRAMFTLQNAPSQPKALGEVNLQLLEKKDEKNANFDISLSVREVDDTLIALFRYKIDLFTEETITKFANNFVSLLNRIVRQPETHLSELPLFKDDLAVAYKQKDYVAPRNETEQAIANIWAEVLNLNNIGMHDNFFDLGGRSLAMMRVYNKLRCNFTIEVPVLELFQSPTIEEMANYLIVSNSKSA
ncbi:thioester reductase-like protein [Xenococcus sp. PCC 7305]|uniref:thioester reductase domain-containing protein n=1 Tax=Xenococcus sp. PCC 7305 TaxID=102125 RepID=UPI0002ABA4B6|nr:thioester reductase domain-containing protein [Xenococcus sp. PCC 7305]ELS02668.1 thioester reductase-like protein [Xenococcus sp. PCC 7305]